MTQTLPAWKPRLYMCCCHMCHLDTSHAKRKKLNTWTCGCDWNIPMSNVSGRAGGKKRRQGIMDHLNNVSLCRVLAKVQLGAGEHWNLRLPRSPTNLWRLALTQVLAHGVRGPRTAFGVAGVDSSALCTCSRIFLSPAVSLLCNCWSDDCLHSHRPEEGHLEKLTLPKNGRTGERKNGVLPANGRTRFSRRTGERKNPVLRFSRSPGRLDARTGYTKRIPVTGLVKSCKTHDITSFRVKVDGATFMASY